MKMKTFVPDYEGKATIGGGNTFDEIKLQRIEQDVAESWLSRIFHMIFDKHREATD